jgi:hypothetical protein
MMKKYSFAWVTAGIFIIVFAGHWLLGWFEYVQDQQDHNASIEIGDYLLRMGRGTLENWQAEFISLVYQIVALTYLYYAGSPQSRGDDERMEALLGAILKKVDPEAAEKLIRKLEREYPKS